jgi:predicted nucleic acid-binding protein
LKESGVAQTLDVIYWDTCIFYALLKGEEHRPGELTAIKKAARLFDDGKIVIATSVITSTEIIEARLPPGVRESYRQMCQRSNFFSVDLTTRISDLASELRDFYYERRDGLPDRTVTTADAIHVISAIQAAAPLWTLDSRDKPNSLGLTNLSTPIMGKYDLVIMRPDMGPEQDLFDNAG